MAIEIATAYVNLVPSARGIQQKIAKELGPVEGIAAAEGVKAGAALGGTMSKGLEAASLGAGIEKSATRATGAGQTVLTRFAQRTGGLFQQLDRQLGNFGGPFTGNLTTIGTSLRTVAAGEKNVALGASEMQRIGTAAYVGLGLAAVGFGAISIKTALGAEQAQAQLEQAVKATGHSFDDVSGDVEAAGKRMAGFGFDIEETNAALAKLTRASKDPQKAISDLAIAADIARAKNLDLGAASQILVNIEAGRVRGLAQLGISTKDSAGNTVTAAVALQRITALYGGSAKANAATYAGELQAVGAEAHNLEEEVGGKLLPIVADLGKELVAGVHGLEDINQATGGWLGTLGLAAFAAGGIAVTVSKVSTGVTKLIDLFGLQKVATEAVTAAEAEQVTVTEADAVAQGELATASAATSDAMEGEAASAGILGTSLTGLAGPLAAVGIGLIAGVKAGGEINKFITGTTPKVDELTASLIGLEKGKDAFDFKGIGGDLKDQISGSGPIQFGKSLADAFTGGGAHRAKQEIGDINTALKSVLQTEGIDKATVAYGKLVSGLEGEGVSVTRIAGDFLPFQAALDLARAKTDDLGTSTNDLSGDFADLAKGFATETTTLGIADQLDAAKQAVDDLTNLKLDAAGKGQKSIEAARAERQAQQSLSDAYRSQASAAANLEEAKTKLAQFNGPTDTRIRQLEGQQIQDRVVTTPDEARQKEIDLLKFGEDNSNKRADLQAQLVNAENGVQSAVEGTQKAEQAASDATAARKQVQVDAANAIAGAERKAEEAILAAGTAISTADVAGQLGAGNAQLDIYGGLLDGLSNKLNPGSPLSKNLDGFVAKIKSAVDLQALLKFAAPIQGLQGGPNPSAPIIAAPTVPAPTGGAGPVGPTVTIAPVQNVTVKGADAPSLRELDTLNKKQALRIAARGNR